MAQERKQLSDQGFPPVQNGESRVVTDTEQVIVTRTHQETVENVGPLLPVLPPADRQLGPGDQIRLSSQEAVARGEGVIKLHSILSKLLVMGNEWAEVGLGNEIRVDQLIPRKEFDILDIVIDIDEEQKLAIQKEIKNRRNAIRDVRKEIREPGLDADRAEAARDATKIIAGEVKVDREKTEAAKDEAKESAAKSLFHARQSAKHEKHSKDNADKSESFARRSRQAATQAEDVSTNIGNSSRPTKELSEDEWQQKLFHLGSRHTTDELQEKLEEVEERLGKPIDNVETNQKEVNRMKERLIVREFIKKPKVKIAGALTAAAVLGAAITGGYFFPRSDENNEPTPTEIRSDGPKFNSKHLVVGQPYEVFGPAILVGDINPFDSDPKTGQLQVIKPGETIKDLANNSGDIIFDFRQADQAGIIDLKVAEMKKFGCDGVANPCTTVLIGDRNQKILEKK